MSTDVNPWLERRVLAYAHQGGGWEAPSSTIFAIRKALDGGADAIELDIHCTADGHLVVCHDPTVDRTTGSTGSIADMALDELKTLDNAYWFVPGAEEGSGTSDTEYPLRGKAPKDRDLGVATLAEVLETFPGVILNLDIKATAPAVPPYEEKLAKLLDDYGRVDDVIVASFVDGATESFRSYASDIALSAGLGAVAEFWRAVQGGKAAPATHHAVLQVPARFADREVIDKQFIAAAHGANLAVHAWTINDLQEMDRLVDLGVDGIISDQPSVLVEVIEAKGLRWAR